MSLRDKLAILDQVRITYSEGQPGVCHPSVCTEVPLPQGHLP
jgi:hypothetical protein